MPPESQESQPEHRSWIRTVLIIVGVLILAGSAYLFFDYFKIEPNSDLTIEQEVDASEWQTYRNEEFGFEFNYPTDWLVRIDDDIRDDIALARAYFYPYDEEFPGGGVTVIVNNDIDYFEKSEIKSRIVSSKTFTKNNISWVFLDFHKEDASEYKYYKWAYTVKEGKLYWLLSPTNRHFELTIELDQILSTFKFIEPAIDISEWQTYRDEKYGIEFRYPLEFSIMEESNYQISLRNGKRWLIFIKDFDGSDSYFYNKTHSTDCDTAKDAWSCPPKEQKVSQVNIGGANFTLRNVENKELHYYSQNPKKTNMVELSLSKEDQETAENILSTFKFIETNTSTPRFEPNYEGFVACITESGATLYGTSWSTHTKTQKEIFGTTPNILPYIECWAAEGLGDAKICEDKGITVYPTWEFGDGSRVMGKMTVVELGLKTSCEVPEGI